MRWASYEEADRLLAAASPHLRPLLLFLMLTGARMSEALELDWTDVNLAERWVVFRGTKRGSSPNGEGRDRGIALHPQLVGVLASLPGNRQGLIFRTDKDVPYRSMHRQRYTLRIRN
jgi:integrase